MSTPKVGLREAAEAVVDRLTPRMVDEEPETIVTWIEEALRAALAAEDTPDAGAEGIDEKRKVFEAAIGAQLSREKALVPVCDMNDAVGTEEGIVVCSCGHRWEHQCPILPPALRPEDADRLQRIGEDWLTLATSEDAAWLRDLARRIRKEKPDAD